MLSLLKRWWLAFGDVLHRITSPVALGAVFLLVVTPTGLLRRLLGRDSLVLRRPAGAQTYWRAADHAAGKGRFTDQF